MKKFLRIFSFLLVLVLLACCKSNEEEPGGSTYPTPAPTGLSAVAGDGRVALKWTAPESDNLKEFDVRWTPGDGRKAVHADSTSCTVTGLTNGTEYAFTVATVYNDGRRSDSIVTKQTPVAPEEPDPELWPEEGIDGTYINNGTIQLGVDMARGGSVFHFSEVNTKRNLLNHADEGRFVQQSYYGESDGSIWNGDPWVWNPIQGGNWQGKRGKVISQEIDRNSIRVVSTPVHWASGKDITECQMEEKITLEGRVAHIHYTFRNTGAGATDHPATDQEVPAVFVDYALKNLVFYDGSAPWTGGSLQRIVPGWPNETHTRTENWAAYVDDSDWGIGVYTPGTANSTNYRFSGPAGPTGGGCSYFAPIRSFAITKGIVFEYDVYLFIGTTGEIREAFNAVRMNGWEIDDTNYPAGYFYVKENSGGITVEKLGSSATEGYTYQWSVTGNDPTLTTQRVPQVLPGPVLTFQYKSNRDVPLSVQLDDNTKTPVRIMPLKATSDWQTYTFDMGQEVERTGWGSIGSRIRFALGGGAGTVIEIKQLRVRARTAAEAELASSLFISMEEPTNDLEDFEDLTDYFSYQTGYTYKYLAKSDALDPSVHSGARTRAIAADENYLTFEYKCAKDALMELFLKEVAGGSVSGMYMPVSNDWREITFDISKGKAEVLKTFPDACDAGIQMRFDIDFIQGVPLYIRAIRIHK